MNDIQPLLANWREAQQPPVFVRINFLILLFLRNKSMGQETPAPEGPPVVRQD